MLKHPIQKVQTSLKNQQQNKKDKPKKANRSTKPPANATHMGMTWNSFESKRNRQECSRERPCEECPSRRSYHNARNVEVYGHGHGQCGLISSICFLGGCVDAENHVIHLRGLGGSRMDGFFHGFFHWTWLRLQHLPKFLRCSVHFFPQGLGAAGHKDFSPNAPLSRSDHKSPTIFTWSYKCDISQSISQSYLPL